MAIYGGARPPSPVVTGCDTFGASAAHSHKGVRAVVTKFEAIYREESAVVTTAQRHNYFTKFWEMLFRLKNGHLLHLTKFIGNRCAVVPGRDTLRKNTPIYGQGGTR